MGLDLNSLNAALHSIKVSNGTYDMSIDSNGYLTISNSSFAVTATALDIRALTNADVVTAEQGTSPWVVSATALDIRALTNADVVTAEQGTDPWVVSATALDIRALTNADVVTAEQGTSPWVVSASDLDIRDLTSASDSVEIKTAAGQALDIDASGYLTANINGVVEVSSGAYDTWKTTAQTVNGTVSQLAATSLADRKNMIVQNLGSADIYVGPSNAVTAANGLLIGKGFSQEIALDAAGTIWAITSSGSSDVRIAEYSY